MPQNPFQQVVEGIFKDIKFPNKNWTFKNFIGRNDKTLPNISM